MYVGPIHTSAIHIYYICSVHSRNICIGMGFWDKKGEIQTCVSFYLLVKRSGKFHIYVYKIKMYVCMERGVNRGKRR